MTTQTIQETGKRAAERAEAGAGPAAGVVIRPVGGAVGAGASSGLPPADGKLRATLLPPWLIRGSTRGQIRAKSQPAFLKVRAYRHLHKNSKRGGVVNTDTRNNTLPEHQGFTTQDVLWALGIWSVILCLSPVIVFYVLMVA